jgi:hypothetical protein
MEKSVNFTVTANDREAAERVSKMQEKLDKLSKRIVAPKIDPDDKLGSIKLREMSAKLEKLNKYVSRPRVSLEGLERANLAIDKLDLKLDAFDAKHAVATVKVRESFLSRITGGRFGGAGGPGGLSGLFSGGGGLSGIMTSPGGLAALLGIGGASLPIGASLIDALSGFGIGTGAAGAGILGVKHFDPKMLAPGLADIQKTLAGTFKMLGPSVGLMFADFGRFFKGQAPNLGKMFAASLPFMRAFMQLAQQASKQIMPAMTQAMNQMSRSGALKQMTQGFVALINSLAMFTRLIGPGFKAGAQAFRAIMMGIGGTIEFLGYEFGKLGAESGALFHKVRDNFDKVRHFTAVAFDAVRHFIAAAWDAIYSNTVGRVSRMVQSVMSFDERLRHGIASTYDSIRHAIASAWDAVYSNTVGRVGSLVGAVVGWFKGLPGKIAAALSSLGSMLYGIARNAISSFISGLGSVGGKIGNFITSHLPFAAGGIVREPVLGVGMRSGFTYSFAERGPEMVTPMAWGGGGGGGVTVIQNFYVQGDTNPDAAAIRIAQILRQYKQRHGNAVLGIA